MRLADMHIHTTFSPDGKSSMEEQCIKAIEIGIPIICFTDHVDFNSSEINVGRIINKASTNFDVSEYFYEVNRLTIPVGFTNEICKKNNDTSNILYCPEFLREGKSLYDNLYPSRIIIGTKTGDPRNAEKASAFADVLKQNALSDNLSILLLRIGMMII